MPSAGHVEDSISIQLTTESQSDSVGNIEYRASSHGAMLKESFLRWELSWWRLRLLGLERSLAFSPQIKSGVCNSGCWSCTETPFHVVCCFPGTRSCAVESSRLELALCYLLSLLFNHPKSLAFSFMSDLSLQFFLLLKPFKLLIFENTLPLRLAWSLTGNLNAYLSQHRHTSLWL